MVMAVDCMALIRHIIVIISLVCNIVLYIVVVRGLYHILFVLCVILK